MCVAIQTRTSHITHTPEAARWCAGADLFASWDHEREREHAGFQGAASPVAAGAPAPA